MAATSGKAAGAPGGGRSTAGEGAAAEPDLAARGKDIDVEAARSIKPSADHLEVSRKGRWNGRWGDCRKKASVAIAWTI